MSDSKVWFVTGASTGFGRAFAEHALAQGHRLVATARNPDTLAALAERAPDRVLIQRLDVTRPDQAQAAMDATLARFGRLDMLINNAGFAVVGAVEETPLDEWRAIMETNFFGAVAVTRAALPILRAQGQGAVVNMSSLGGQLSVAGFGAYSATKFALEGFSEALAGELTPLGVKVLIVEPGAFRTELAGGAMRAMPPIAAYQDSVGPTRAFAAGMHRTQDGDPRKAAAAIERALAADPTPLRLQLGADSVQAVRGHAQTLLADLAQWEAVANATGFDPA